MNRETGSLLVISGASGVGKSTVIAQLLRRRDQLYFSVSWTTRAPRPGETDGVNYHFTDRADFEARIAAGDFLEHAEYVGNYYGTARSQVEQKRAEGFDVLLDIEVQGAAQVKKNSPDAVSVFIVPPSMTELEKRLRERGTDSEEKIKGRLARAREEVREAGGYDYIVVNDRVEAAVDELLAILTAERCRTKRRIHLTE